MKPKTKTDIILVGIILTFAAVILFAAQTEKANAEDCIPLPTGECLTVAMYDDWFGYDNLTQVPLHQDSTMSVAEAYNIQPDTASTRARTFMGEPLPTFVAVFETWHRVNNGWIIE